MMDGSYLVCGIPEDLTTNVIAVRGTDSTASIPIAFNRFLALQSFSMPPLLSDSTIATKQPTNHAAHAIVRGKVLGPDNKPLSGARVSVEDDRVATTSDASGLFTLTGARPGTRELTVRRIGFQPVEIPVELSSIHARDVVVQLKNTVKVLEAVRISALREVGLERVGFADRKRSAFGKFYSPQDIESRDPLRLTYLLETAPMLRAGRTTEGKRYITGRQNGCIRYFVDGRLMMDAKNDDLDVLPDSYLSMAEIGAVEVYDSLSQPAEYIAYHQSLPCAIVVIWTKWKLGPR
jgi:hypothetical protein